MGLDMYVYKVTKLSNSDVDHVLHLTPDEIQNIDEDDYFSAPVNMTLCDRIDGIKKYDALFPFLTKIHVPRQFVNLAQMKKDFGIPEDWSTGGQGWSWDPGTNKNYNAYHFSNPDCTADREVKLEDEEFEQKYVYIESADCYLWREEEVSYWRKEYELRDRLHRMIGNAENCGYYPVTADMKTLMKRYHGFTNGIPRVNHKTTELFYHPWW